MTAKEIKLKVRHEIGMSGHPFCGDYTYTFTDRELEDYISLLIAERMPNEEEADKWADYCASNTTEDHDKRVVYKAALSLGTIWFRSRMKGSDKPMVGGDYSFETGV